MNATLFVTSGHCSILSAGFGAVSSREASRSNWHVEAICDHLEAVVDWQIKRGLLINIPPRHMKSLTANVFFPAWVWSQNPNPDRDVGYPFQIRPHSWRGPGVKFMHLSYASNLATRDGMKWSRPITSGSGGIASACNPIKIRKRGSIILLVVTSLDV
jgi:hypothetical protein